MVLEFYIFLFISGIIVGVSSGLLGIGGALLMFPILLYVPQMLGLNEMSEQLVSGVVAMQTLFGTAASAFFHKRSGNINFPVVFKVSAGMIIGASIGALSSKYMPGVVITWVYAAFLVIALLILLFKKEVQLQENQNFPLKIRGFQAFVLGLFVGAPAGIVGLGGSVVLIPALNGIFGVPMKICIGSAAMISCIGSIATFMSKAFVGQVQLMNAIIVSLAATFGAFIGTFLNKKSNSGLLRIVLIVLIVLALGRVCASIFFAY